MSHWRRLLNELAKLPPGEYPIERFELYDADYQRVSKVRSELVGMGLLSRRRATTPSRRTYLYSLTTKGRQVAEGAIAWANHGGHGGGKFAATWLALLPKGVTIRPQEVLL